MKILSLNTWGGRRYKPLMEYIKKQSRTIDVFCFQEVWRSMARRKIVDGCRTHLFDEIAALFGSRFVGCYSSRQEGIALSGPVGFDLSFGQGIFWRKSLSCDPIKDLFLFRSKDSLFDDLPILPSVNRSDLKAVARARRAQWKKELIRDLPALAQIVQINDPRSGKKLVIINVHAQWYPGDKRDTQARIKQSKKLIAALESIPGPKVICGDFNLEPDTKSIALIEQAGYRNLITEYCIADTRGPINKKLWHDTQHYADYCFVSKGLRVTGFTVPPLAVSDHLPMILECS